MKNKTTKQLVRSAVLIALGLILPYFFHAIPQGGVIFAPMHIPILIGGFILSPLYATLVGVITPFLSHVFTGMPPFPIVYVMIFELATYGLLVSLFFNKNKMGIYSSLILGMICGRGVNILGNYVILHLILKKPFAINMVLTGLFVKSLPGIIVQIIFIPLVVIGLKKAGMLQEDKSLNA